MVQKSICDRLFAEGAIVPAVRNVDDFKYALNVESPSIILLFGDIIILPSIIQEAKRNNKRVLVHLDLLGGIGKDRSGIRYLARLGVTGAITTKPQLVKFAREEGMVVIQRLFVMDSEALKSGIHLLRNCKPDAVEILPASVPKSIVEELVAETDLPVLAGGLMHTMEDVENALGNGVHAVSTSRRELWR